MRKENPQVEAPAPAKKAYVKPSVTKHTAASLVVGSTCGYYTTGYYVVVY